MALEKKEKIKVLYIDDEVNNLNSFKASFRFDYNVFTAIGATEAHKMLNDNPDIRVILSDQRMPDKTGVEFFEEVHAQHPSPIRILITGYTDIESVIEAINRGHIFRYIKKPWTDTDIQTAIDQANKFYIATSMLAVKNEELQKAYKELDKFAYSVTHDMRGPLLSIIGAIDVAKSIDNLPEIAEMLSMMGKSVHKLDNFIKSTHEYYNLQRGELHITEIDFNNIIKDVDDMYSVTGKMNNVNFACHVKQEGVFRSDEMSLTIILNNLISNAFKYQKKENIDKKIELNVEIDKGNAIIYVKDNGIGIDSSHINDIFNMFYRGPSEEAGSGFGLYNVKDALRKLNGNIDVSSIVNEGTVFKVTIPSK